MKTISGYLLTSVFGWKIRGEFPDFKKCIVIFAPHTSYFDAFFGKLLLNEIVGKHTILSKKELFFFPMNIVMRLFGSIPVRGVKAKNSILCVVQILNESQELHIIISPEGTRKKVTRWNTGFYYMALKADVPIVVGYLDYKNKEIGIKGVIENLDNKRAVMQQLNLMYKDVTAKYPENFSIDLNN